MPPSLPPEAAALLEVAMRAGMAPAFWAARDPDRPAVIAPPGDRTFDELNTHANQLVRALRRRGLGEGDAVALLCGNRAEFAETWAACNRAGFRLTNVNWHLTPEESAYIVRDCRARAFIADATHAAAVPPAEHVGLRIAVGGALPEFEVWDDVLSAEDGTDIDDPTLGTTMLYTSGTTGYPKGVAKPPDPDGLITSVAVYQYRDGNVHLCTGPLYHAAPFSIALVPPLSCGVPVVMMERWDAEETLALVEEHRVTHMHLVPTMFHRLLSLPPAVRDRYDVSSLRAIVHGAAPCPVPVKQGIIEWFGPIVHEYYSATEGYGTGVDSPTWLTKPGTVGRANPAHLYVGDPDGQRLGTDEEGLVWIKATGKARFEYFGDEEKTGSAFRGDYFTLGDVGRVDEDGFLYLTDRSANLIISGGVNIYPAEIDAVLLQHPAVADAGTIGVPDDEWGERVLAVVEPKPEVDRQGLADELLAFCRERLAGFKCPRAVDLVDHLPRDENGKLYKRRLRDEYRARHEQALSGKT
ncbi:MAG: AMP-binding protein [Acidimicrobiales bacterium]